MTSSPKQGRGVLKVKFTSVCQDENSIGFGTIHKCQMWNGLLSREWGGLGGCTHAHIEWKRVRRHAYILRAHCSGILLTSICANTEEAHYGLDVKIVGLLCVTGEPTFQLLNILFVETLVFCKSKEVNSLKGPSVLVGEWSSALSSSLNSVFSCRFANGSC